jgi:hypothetical protein
VFAVIISGDPKCEGKVTVRFYPICIKITFSHYILVGVRNAKFQKAKIMQKVKSKAVPLHAMETLGGGGIAPTHT